MGEVSPASNPVGRATTSCSTPFAPEQSQRLAQVAARYGQHFPGQPGVYLEIRRTRQTALCEQLCKGEPGRLRHHFAQVGHGRGVLRVQPQEERQQYGVTRSSHD
jgi:hypothetical protein